MEHIDTLTDKQKQALKQVFVTYMRNGWDYAQVHGIEKTLETALNSRYGPGPDFFPAIEAALD